MMNVNLKHRKNKCRDLGLFGELLFSKYRHWMEEKPMVLPLLCSEHWLKRMRIKQIDLAEVGLKPLYFNSINSTSMQPFKLSWMCLWEVKYWKNSDQHFLLSFKDRQRWNLTHHFLQQRCRCSVQVHLALLERQCFESGILPLSSSEKHKIFVKYFRIS